MIKGFEWKRFMFYVWVGLAFLIIRILADTSAYPDTATPRVFNNLWRIIYIVIVNFLLFEYSIPRLSRKKIGKSILLIIAHIFLYSWGLYVWREIGLVTGVYTSLAEFESPEQNAATQMAYSMQSFIFFFIIKHIYDYIKLRQAAQQLRIEKQQAELNYLKSQTNPHFLFNTLNNIYSLARDKSDLAPESILRLSKILRFMLYETSGDYISIEQEVKIINDYIALEKLRYDDSLRVNFMYDVENMNQPVPPLLLIPLVENAFKHGVSETRGRPFVEIRLSATYSQLLFVVKNSMEDAIPESGVKENIGLSNLRRQLELLYTNHSLVVSHDGSTFTTTLKINLRSHV
ncbi:MAG: histidine kinase [Chitinophagaceae bacterium]|nr:histidine kinase [Chitinophagaceae bacterium]